MKKYDYLIAGAGIIGTQVALALKERYKTSKILVIDKEKEFAFHSSGRNSGVLHAGFYYTENSLKAKFTREGNQFLTDFALKKGLPINRCGKLVVAQNKEEVNTLKLLYQRGLNNSVPLELISEKEAHKMEPQVKTVQHALYSPSTSSIDPKELLVALIKEARQKGIEFHTNEKYISSKKNEQSHSLVIRTSQSQYSTGYFVNAAGLYADKIAHDFGFGKNYIILPFKGLYFYSKPRKNPLKMHIYPVPDLRNPFLGVHHTVDAHNHNEIGPTAIPAFWKENYSGFYRFKLSELIKIFFLEARLFLGFGKKGFDFRSLAIEEIKKYSRRYLIRNAAQLADGIHLSDYIIRGKPGIRAQLYNKKENYLEMDFKIEADAYSLHVLNAVSPAFTASRPFSEYIVNNIEHYRNS